MCESQKYDCQAEIELRNRPLRERTTGLLCFMSAAEIPPFRVPKDSAKMKVETMVSSNVSVLNNSKEKNDALLQCQEPLRVLYIF